MTKPETTLLRVDAVLFHAGERPIPRQEILFSQRTGSGHLCIRKSRRRKAAAPVEGNVR